MLYQEIIRKLENTEPCYFDNCLRLANFLRCSFNLSPFPDEVLEKAEDLEKADFKFIHRYFVIYGNKVEGELQNFDTVLMNFSHHPCIGTYIDGFIFYLDGLGMSHQPLENIGRFIVYTYRMF